jgi:hypothetical protein
MWRANRNVILNLHALSEEQEISCKTLQLA